MVYPVCPACVEVLSLFLQPEPDHEHKYILDGFCGFSLVPVGEEHTSASGVLHKQSTSKCLCHLLQNSIHKKWRRETGHNPVWCQSFLQSLLERFHLFWHGTKFLCRGPEWSLYLCWGTPYDLKTAPWQHGPLNGMPCWDLRSRGAWGSCTQLPFPQLGMFWIWSISAMTFPEVFPPVGFLSLAEVSPAGSVWEPFQVCWAVVCHGSSCTLFSPSSSV